jgi:hypothetical protein
MKSCTPSSENQLPRDPLAIEITQEQASEYARELSNLNDVAFVFLNATDNDHGEAEKLLDSAIDLLFEGGALSTWRYRILLAEIRKGL